MSIALWQVPVFLVPVLLQIPVISGNSVLGTSTSIGIIILVHTNLSASSKVRFGKS
jgi:hypothetical protein